MIQKRDVTKATIGLALAALLGACASAPDTQKPTHYWESADVQSERTYRQDHQNCSTDTGISGGEMRADSDSFSAYQDCMISRGYVLKTY